MKSPTVTTTIAVAAALALAACGSDADETSSDATSTSEPADTSTSESTQSPPTTADAPSPTSTTVPASESAADETSDDAEPGAEPVIQPINGIADVEPEMSMACDAEPIVRTNAAGVDFVRTPDSCFDEVEFPGIDYEPRYVEVDDLRVHYVEAGPADGEVVLMLHGEPSWSYLYRDMIAEFADNGYRAIAMDFPGMGRSDKPVDIEAYTYEGQTEQVAGFMDELGIDDVHLVVQDWGANVGLRLAGLEPDRFASVTTANGSLPRFPEGAVPFPPVENPDELDTEVEPYYADWPDQQEPFRDANGEMLEELNFNETFVEWMTFTMKSPDFKAGEMVEANTWFPITDAEEAAYDAPFPRREYMALARAWPSMFLEVGGVNEEAWTGLTTFERPFLTLYTPNDPGVIGEAETYQPYIDEVPGAAGQPHGTIDEASHFVQDDQGVELAQRIIEFIDLNRS